MTIIFFIVWMPLADDLAGGAPGGSWQEATAAAANRAAPHLGITAGGVQGCKCAPPLCTKPKATAIGSQFLSSLAMRTDVQKNSPANQCSTQKMLFKNQRSLSIRTFPQPPLGQYCIINPRKRSQICRKTNDGFGIWR